MPSAHSQRLCGLLARLLWWRLSLAVSGTYLLHRGCSLEFLFIDKGSEVGYHHVGNLAKLLFQLQVQVQVQSVTSISPFCANNMADGRQNGLLESNQIPSAATDAVLKPSAPMPQEVEKVRGIEFNNYRDHPITAEELVAGMGPMGFQASAVAEAVRIINDMVGSSMYR